jgi:hypothetical protein
VEPRTLTLDESATETWSGFYQNIEKEMRVSGDCADLRDFAGKAAHQASRLAGLFQFFNNGAPDGTVTNQRRFPKSYDATSGFTPMAS